MRVGDRIEYQAGLTDFGIGIVTAYDDETEIVTVKDEDDGTNWHGPADLTTSLDD